ncbi:MAG: RluA family pseudouridine synthase [Patescibacteria group bacterium]|nr:RluA family pseudouridine synthase [Patescibacteria group bacterium]
MPKKSEKNLFTVKEKDAGARLDVFLALSARISRSRAQKMIRSGGVMINGRPETPHFSMRPGDRVELVPLAEKKIRKITPRISVVHKDNDFIVINKPNGIVVHAPNEKYSEPTVVDFLLKKFPEIAKVGDPRRPGIVQRLDRDVSGLMVVARNKKSYAHLRSAFESRAVKKIYLGLAHGRLDQDEGEINFKIARSVRRARMAARPESQEGKEALTRYCVIQRFPSFTLTEIEILTGRTHQIRAHFFAIGHPLAGDALYRAKRPGKIRAPRLFLHSTYLGFYDMADKWREFRSEPPEELNTFLKIL